MNNSLPFKGIGMPEKLPKATDHFAWLNLWIVILVVVIPIGFAALGLINGPIVALVCWIISGIAFTHLIWINPLLKYRPIVKSLFLIAIISGLGWLSWFGFKNKPEIGKNTTALDQQKPVQTPKPIKNYTFEKIKEIYFEGKNLLPRKEFYCNETTKLSEQQTLHLEEWKKEIFFKIPTRYKYIFKDEGSMDSFYDQNPTTAQINPCNRSDNQKYCGYCVPFLDLEYLMYLEEKIGGSNLDWQTYYARGGP